MKDLKVGVVGLGVIGNLHCRAVNEHPRLHLTAVADADAGTAAAARSTWAVPSFASVAELLSEGGLDALIVCTPEDAHEEPVRCALQAGKHVLVEKPMATSSSRAASLVALADEHGLVLLPGHVLRFDPRYAHAYQAVRDGRLGPLAHISAKRCNPCTAARRVQGRVSLIYYLGIHDIDAALWISGQAPVSAYAQATSQLNGDLGVEDSIFALLRLGGGHVVSLEFSWSLPKRLGARLHGGMEVVGRDGMVRIDLERTGLSETGPEGPAAIDPLHWPVVHDRLRGDLAEEVDHFAKCVLDGAPQIVTGVQAVTAVHTAEAILASISSGEVVSI